jgi:hypothetical protein
VPFGGLNIEGVDTAELVNLLQLHFGMAENQPPRKIVFMREMDSPCLSINFDSKWEISSIETHGALDDVEIAEINDKIESQLRQSNGIYVFRDSLFYTVNVETAYKYSDTFQVFPVPPGSATSDSLLGPHPFVLEVAVPASSDPFTSGNRGRLKARKIKNVLAVLLQYNVSATPTFTQHVWVLNDPTDPPSVSLKQRMYTCMDPNWRPDCLRDITNHATCPMVLPADYYAKYGISGGEGLELPANIDDQFDRYFSMGTVAQQRFDRACYWYNHAYDVWSLSKSASYVALVIAIECMLDGKPDVKPCETCGKTPTDGPTKQFRSFIEAHVPGADELKTVKGELYRIRSRMAHGSRVMANDIGSWHDPMNASEDALHRQLTRLVQFALVNWLAST